jgi:hypothetical protein
MVAFYLHWTIKFEDAVCNKIPDFLCGYRALMKLAGVGLVHLWEEVIAAQPDLLN